MLNIFTKRDLIADEDYILDNDSYFVYTGVKDNDIVRGILRAIDKATICDGRLIDRFGVSIYSSMLSTGSKTLINIASSDKVFDGREMGYNALKYLFNAVDGNVYFEDTSVLGLIEDIESGRYSLNNVVINSEKELDELC